MAKKGAKIATNSKNMKYNTKWLRNAMKSIGVTANEVMKDISPNVYEVVSTGANVSKNIISNIMGNTNSTNKITDALNNNKYVKFAQNAYKNAMSDIKSGTFNNTERFMDMDNAESESGFTFGDEDGSINVNITNPSDTGAAMAGLSDQIGKQSMAQVKMQKATMDAYIAVNAASMQQVGQIGTEVLSSLNNINNNLAALIQYNNDNVTKFIEASIAFYEKSGVTNSKVDDKPTKIKAGDVFNNSNGGISLSKYKQYVKQQMKDMAKNSELGMIKSLLDDDQMLSMLASNPLGFLSKGLASYMMPKILKTSIESMEKTFSNFLPTMLSQLSDLADETGIGVIGKIRQTIGATFGLRNKRTTSFGKATIERGAISFDNETKHAITEIITKELREQTGYLQIIANHYDKNATSKAKNNGEYWSWQTGTYVKKTDIDQSIATEIVDAVKGVMYDSKFGESMKKLINGYTTESSRKEMEFTVEELFMEIEKSGKHISLPDLITLVQNGGANEKTKKIIIKYIKKMAANDPDSYYSLNTARLKSQAEADEVKNRIKEDPTAYQLYNSSFANNANIDDIIGQVMGYGKENSSKRRAVKSINMPKYDGVVGDRKGNGIFANAFNASRSFMVSLMKGDSKGAINTLSNAMTEGITSIGSKISTTLFGEKNEDGYRKNGIFSGVNDGFVDLVNSFKHSITGKGYTDSNGTTIADSEDSVIGNFKKVGSIVKDGIMLKLFGKEKDENGKYIASEKAGLFGTITKSFKDGFNGWLDAFFGIEGAENPEELRKQKTAELMASFKKSLPDALTGASFGIVGGALANGSILGTLIGGPIGGAAIGAALGFAKRSDKFQNWLFGEKDENGERTGGLISKNVQKFTKENKTFLVGSGAVGLASGAITGGGLLGTLVGGPIAGAIMGLAGGVILKSNMFKEFLFGDEKKGKLGLIKNVTNAFNKGFRKSDAAGNGLKSIGMAAIGAMGGGLTASVIGSMGLLGASLTPLGPIGGALIGLSASIKAQSGSFREYLFGKENGLKIGKDKTVRKVGLFGQIGNTINANIIRPMKTEFKFIGKDFMNTVKHKVLEPFSWAAEYGAEKLGNVASYIAEGVNGVLSPISSSVKKAFGGFFEKMTSGIGKGMEKITDFAYKSFKSIISTPGMLIKATLDVLGVKDKIKKVFKPVTDLVKDVRHLIFLGIKKTFGLVFKGVKGILKGVFNVATAPFRLLGKGIKGLANLTSKFGNFIADKTKLGGAIRDRFNEYRNEVPGSSLSDRIKVAKHNAKIDAKRLREEIANERRHNKNAKLINKLSKGQFSEDTEEARQWLYYNNRRAYRKLVDIDPETGKSRNTSITEEQNQARIEKEGRGTNGMSPDELARADLSSLNEQGRQTYFLQGIFNILKGNNWDGTDKKSGKGKQGKKKKDNNTDNTAIADNSTTDTEDGVKEEEKPVDDSQKALDNRIFGRTRQNLANLFSFIGSKLPHFAEGGETEDGYAVVGEDEPEIIKTNDGDEVINSKQAKARLASKKRKKQNRKKRRAAAAKMRKQAAEMAEEDSQDAFIEGQTRSMLDKARDDAKTAKELQKERQEEKDREEQRKTNAEMLKATKENKDINEKFSLNWSGIFSKKGLLTGAALLGFAFLKNKLPAIFNGIMHGMGLLGKIAGKILGGTVKDVVEDVEWTEENNARTNGNSMDDQAKKNIKDIKDGNFLTDENGDATHQTASRSRFLGRRALNFATSRISKPITKLGKIEKGAYNAIKTVGKAGIKVGKGIGKAGIKVGKGIGGLAKKGISKIKVPKLKIGGKKGGKMAEKLAGYVTKFFDFVKNKVAKKAGKEVAEKGVDKTLKKGILKTLTANIDNIAAKVSATLGVKVSGAALSFGISEAIFAGVGGIEGISGTAKLFQVPAKKVDGTMRTISGILGALAGTTVGSVVDIIFSMVGDIMGFDIMHSLAVSIYNAMAGSKKADKLKNAQDSYKNEYKKYQDKELKKQLKAQQKAGIVDPKLSLKEFKKGIKKGKYKANYKSFQDWNTDKNKSIGDSISSGVGKAFKGTKKGLKAIKGFLFKKKTEKYVDSNGITYTEGKNGMWVATDASGTKLGEISKDAIPKDAKKVTKSTDGVITKAGKGIKSGWNATVKGTKAAVNYLGSGFKILGKGIKTGASKAKNAVVATSKSIFKKTSNFLTSHKEKRWIATTGGYYQTNGSTFDYYNDTGSKVAEGITMEEFNDLVTSGVVSADSGKEVTIASGISKKFNSLRKSIGKTFSNYFKHSKAALKVVGKAGVKLFKDIKEKGLVNTIKGVFKPSVDEVWYDTQGNYYKENSDETYNKYNINGDVLDEKIDGEKVKEMQSAGLLTKGKLMSDSKAKKAINKIQDAVGNAWDKAKKTVTSNWKKFTSFITGGHGIGSSSGGRGGFGDSLNGGTYFSQNDSRWGNNSYNQGQDNATMSTSGCGPTAMAMAASDVTGKKITPDQMANLAKMTGNRDETGTNWNFINQASNSIGIASNQKLHPSASDINSQLDAGGPVILSGVGGTGSDPYTKSGHYVVATGKDENGKVMINDPRGKQYSRTYSISDIANKTGSSWSFGGYGKLISPYLSKKQGGGHGIDVSKWISIVKSVKAAIAAQKPGYSQTNWINITVNGKTLRVRTDCSGFTGACLKFFGVLGEGVNVTSSSFLGSGDSSVQKTGFTHMSWSGWDNLREGDIIAVKGHVEIFCTNKNGKHYVYNCGSKKSVNNPGATVTGHAAYTDVWRPGEGGSTSASIENGATTSEASADTGSKFDKLTSYMSSFFSEFGSRALTGDTNTDYSSLLSNGSSSTESSDSGGIAAANISGSDVKKAVWDYFTSAGYSKAATAGILGNLQQESGVNPNAIQGNGRGPAAGIAQWENYNTKKGRWKSMADYAASKGKSWTDLGSQLEYMNKELHGSQSHYFKTGSALRKAGATPTTIDEFMKSNDVEMATRQFEGAFERAGKPNMPNRIAAAKGYYKKYAGGGNGAGISTRNRYIPIHKGITGGYGSEVDYTSSNSLQTKSNSNLYKTSTNASRYITTTKDSGVNALLYNVIEILVDIAGNTSETSTKLNALKNLQNNANNIVIKNNSTTKGGGKIVGNSDKSIKPTKSDLTAKQIAKGGF